MKSLALAPALFLSLAVHAQTTAYSAVPCGARGNVETRIADCEKKNGSGASKEVRADGRQYAWKLVARLAGNDNSEGYGETWLDSSTGLVWGPRLSGTFDHETALSACKNWRLPTADDFRDAESHGVRDVLKGLAGKHFWSSTRSDYETAAFYFSGTGGYVEDGNRDVRRSVRCVLRTRL